MEIYNYFEEVGGRTIRIPAGEKVFRQGELILNYHLLRSGLVKLGWKQDFCERLFAIRAAGDVLESEFQEGPVREGYFAETVTDVELSVVNASEFVEKILKNSWVLHELFYQMETDLTFQKTLRVIEARASSEVKLAFLLYHLHKQLSERSPRSRAYQNIIPLTQAELCKSLTLSRMTIYKCMSRLNDKGAVRTVYGGVQILNSSILRKEIDLPPLIQLIS